MNELIFKQLNESAKSTSKALFSCHPDDFDLFFNDITRDILSTKVCVIYYLEDQNYTPDDIDDYYSYLKDVSLFIFPITRKYIEEPSRARDIDFEYALKNKVAILPILVEPNLYNLFNEKCASIQVLDKTSKDPTQDPYKVKLSGFLEAVLVDSETAEKIKQAFDAYVFLSYRKKDRKYAQEIMSVILKNDFMRDVAIWYDEFLTPGEDFNNEISQNLLKSKLMALVVTPNINERYGDKGNYVIEEEYPSAIKENKPVLPIEALPTDINELKDNFKNIKDPIHKDSSNDISNSLKELLFKEGIKENNDPLHLYFIGLAYLNGIDTERNVDRAVKILDKSLDKGLIEAGFALFRTCCNQLFNYPKAIEYADRTIKMMNGKYSDYIAFLREYFEMLRSRAYYDNALEINKIIYDVSNEDDKLERKNIEAKLYSKKGDNKKCVDILYELYQYCKDRYGINNERTQRNGYSIFWFCNDEAIIKELENDGLNFYAHIFGDETEEKKPEKKPDDLPPSLDMLLNRFSKLSNVGKVTEELIDVSWKIANQYYKKEQYSEHLEFRERNYEYCEELYGTLDTRTERKFKGVLASYQDYYRKTKDESHFDRMLTLCEQNYNKKAELLGEKNPKTMASLDVFARNCKLCKKTDKAIDLMKKRLNLLVEIYGSTHPNVTALQDELKSMMLS